MAHAVYELIDRIAAEQGVRLTNPAREMLALPVIEQYPNDREMNSEIVGSSIRLIVSAAMNAHSDDTPADFGALNTRAIIFGFKSRYCNIPPFGGR